MNDLVHLASRETDTRKGRQLEYFTLGWNLTEAVVGIGAGVIAGSIAFIGFGVDSIIESFSGASLALNALFGWSWADSIAAILMVPIITREGIEALRGDACDNCS